MVGYCSKQIISRNLEYGTGVGQGARGCAVEGPLTAQTYAWGQVKDGIHWDNSVNAATEERVPNTAVLHGAGNSTAAKKVANGK